MTESYNAYYTNLSLDRISPDPEQPRKEFSEIEALAASIKERGILQPISVRTDPNNEGHYIINHGERRWRASKDAGINEIPCFIDDKQEPVDALLENLQRQDLTPIETADYIKKLINSGLTSKEVASKLGKNKDWISLQKRISEADIDIRNLFFDGVITDGRSLAELQRMRDKYSFANEFIDSIKDRETPISRKEIKDFIDQKTTSNEDQDTGVFDFYNSEENLNAEDNEDTEQNEEGEFDLNLYENQDQEENLEDKDSTSEQGFLIEDEYTNLNQEKNNRTPSFIISVENNGEIGKIISVDKYDSSVVEVDFDSGQKDWFDIEELDLKGVFKQ